MSGITGFDCIQAVDYQIALFSECYIMKYKFA